MINTPVHELTDEHVQEELKTIQDKHRFVRPERSKTDPTLPWLNGVPDYNRSDLLYFRAKSQNHQVGSAEQAVENTVKRWKMEATHLPFDTWTNVQHSDFRVSANGGHVYDGTGVAPTGFYNLLLMEVDKSIYNARETAPEDSNEIFKKALLGGFPWELVQLLSRPPLAVFTWRHWAVFNGELPGRKGDGGTYELYGLSVVSHNDEGKITHFRIYLKSEPFIQTLYGVIPANHLKRARSLVGTGCPFLSNASSIIL